MKHGCHAIGCTVAVPPKMLMCPAHWRRVSPRLQRAVWQTYRPGQERDKQPSARYLVVQAMAVGYVAALTGRWGTDEAVAHIFGRIDQVKDRFDDEDRGYVVSLFEDVTGQKLMPSRPAETAAPAGEDSDG